MQPCLVEWVWSLLPRQHVLVSGPLGSLRRMPFSSSTGTQRRVYGYIPCVCTYICKCLRACDDVSILDEAKGSVVVWCTDDNPACAQALLFMLARWFAGGNVSCLLHGVLRLGALGGSHSKGIPAWTASSLPKYCAGG